MKPLPLILIVLLAVGAGAAGGWLASRCAQSASAASSYEALQPDLKSQSGLPAKPAGHEAELSAKVENLERALDAIHQDVMELRTGSSRTAAVAIEPEKAPIDTDSVAFAAQHKTAIKAVIEEDRAEQARKAEEERKQRDIQQTQQRADRTAQRVGLNPAQTKQLEGFYEQQRVRMDDVRGNMQNLAGGDPQAMRQTFQEFRAWSETELTTLFGSDLSAKIMEEGGGFGMGRGGPGGPGGGGQGGFFGGGAGTGGQGTGGQNAGAARAAQGTDTTGGGGRRRRNGGTGAQPAAGGDTTGAQSGGAQTTDGQAGGGGG
jgi:hypothetical protein